MKLYAWHDWMDTELLEARPAIEKAHESLSALDDDYSDLPREVTDALEVLNGVMKFYAEHDRTRLAEYNALYPKKKPAA